MLHYIQSLRCFAEAGCPERRRMGFRVALGRHDSMHLAGSVLAQSFGQRALGTDPESSSG